jgi:hypothetical protein
MSQIRVAIYENDYIYERCKFLRGIDAKAVSFIKPMNNYNGVLLIIRIVRLRLS